MSSLQRSSSASPIKPALLTAMLCVLSAGCAEEQRWVEQRRLSMGTWVDTIYLTPDPQTAAILEREIDQYLQQYEVDYYAWSDGELARLNAALQSGEQFMASPALTSLLERSQRLSIVSEGFFDPGVGLLVEAWGFHSSESAAGNPDAEFLTQWRRKPTSIADLNIADSELSATTARLKIDLGGIAKGEIVDRVLEHIAATGVSDALINAGGDVRVIGQRDDRKWSIGIQAPRGEELLGRIELNDGEAAFTSGDYERFIESDGGRQHHLIDPISGVPAVHTQAVTVIADNGALADAAATALFIAGPANWRRIAAALGVTYVLRVNADGSIEMTSAMRERVLMQAAAETATMIRQSGFATL